MSDPTNPFPSPLGAPAIAYSPAVPANWSTPPTNDSVNSKLYFYGNDNVWHLVTSA